MPDPVEPKAAPAGIVKIPGVDDALDELAAEEDRAREREEWFEGKDLTRDETEKVRSVFFAVLRECNKHLDQHKVCLLACQPEERGFGATLIGIDTEGRDYKVDVHVGDDVRTELHRLPQERLVRELIDAVVSQVIKERTTYLSRGDMRA